jgi:hypothetical protein
MKKTWRQKAVGGLVMAVVMLVSGGFAQAQNTASVTGHGRSLSVGPLTRFIPGYGTVYVYITTFDGASGYPLVQNVGGNGYISQEFRPRGSGVYEADYLVFDPFGSTAEYGYFTAGFPTTDTDGNGIPDFFQRNFAGSASFGGNGHADWPSTENYTINGSFSRPANNSTGSIQVSTSTGNTYTGQFRLVYLSGSISYVRGGPNTINLTITVDAGGVSATMAGSTTFTVNSQNQIVLAQFDALDQSSGETYTLFQTTLNRSGKKFTGEVELFDGELTTAWRDYTKYVIEITDNNDTDGDGVPDLSDTPTAPTIAVAKNGGGFRITTSAQPSHTYTLLYSNDLNTWSPVQSLLAGGTQVTWDHTPAGAKGFYRVRVP